MQADISRLGIVGVVEGSSKKEKELMDTDSNVVIGVGGWGDVEEGKRRINGN